MAISYLDLYFFLACRFSQKIRLSQFFFFFFFTKCVQWFPGTNVLVFFTFFIHFLPLFLLFRFAASNDVQEF